MTVTRRITGHWLRGCHCCPAKQRGNNECCRILHSGPVQYHFVVAVWRAKKRESGRVKYWEIIADNLSKAGWSWGCVSAVDSQGRTIWIGDAHRGIMTVTRRITGHWLR